MNRIMLLLLVLGLCVVAVVFTLFIGWLMDDDRNNKRKLDDDTDTRLYVPSRCRDRSSNNRRDKQVEEIKELAKKMNVKIGGDDDDKESK